MTGDMLQEIRGRRVEDSQARGKHEENPRAGPRVLAGLGIHGEGREGARKGQGKVAAPAAGDWRNQGPEPPCHRDPAP